MNDGRSEWPRFVNAGRGPARYVLIRRAGMGARGPGGLWTDDLGEGRGPERPEAVLVPVPAPRHDRGAPRRGGPPAAVLGPDPRHYGRAVLLDPRAAPPARDAPVDGTVK